MSARRACTLATLLLAALAGRAAQAQPTERAGEPTARFGVARAERLVASADAAEIVRGVERLGAIGSPRALATLSDLVSAGTPGGSIGLLTVVRALAPHAGDPVALRALVRVMSADGSSGGDDQLAPWARASAALALARSDRPEAWEALRQALGTDGPLGEIAAAAVLAHPPRDVAVLLGGRPVDSVRLVETLGSLGDQRAFPAVRAAITAGPAELRARAAVVLTRLGAFETVPLARQWLAVGASGPFQLAAAEILALARAPDAPAAIAALAESESTRGAWLGLVRATPQREAVPLLLQALATAEGPEWAALCATLGSAGGPAATRALAERLDDPDAAGDAAYALALAPDAAAEHALAAALERPSARRAAARGAVIRAITLGRAPRGLRPRLESLLDATEPADRAVGAWGLAALDPRRGAELIQDGDAVVVAAAARTAMTPDVAAAAAARLEREREPALRTALASALASGAGRARVSTATLIALVESDGAAAPLAARALAARGTPGARPHLDRLLTSAATDLRAHAALGLGDNPDPSAVGRLERAYRFEPDATVRRAIVTALGRRAEPARRRALALAADLDADAPTRAVARAALAMQSASLDPVGRGAVWVSVLRPEGTPATGVAVAVRLPSGVVLPALPDPDGTVTLVAVPLGEVELRLAALPRTDNPAAHHGREGEGTKDGRHER